MLLPRTGGASALLALTAPAAFLAGTYLFTEALRAVVPSSQVVKVRGVAEKVIESDRVDWSISVRYLDPSREGAFAKVDETVERLRGYLFDHGVEVEALHVGPHDLNEQTRRVVADKLGNYRTERLGFEVSRELKLKGFENLDLVDRLSKQIGADLLRQGWPVHPRSPHYFYSRKVSDLKPELLKAAATNAFDRASIVARSSGSTLGGLKAARQGAFEGMGDDGYVGGYKRTHRIRAIVTVDYAVGR